MLTRPTSSRAAPEEVGGTQLAKCFVHEHHPHPLAHWQPWDPCEAAAMGRGAVHWDGRSTGPAAARGGAAFIWGWCRAAGWEEGVLFSGVFLRSPFTIFSRLATCPRSFMENSPKCLLPQPSKCLHTHHGKNTIDTLTPTRAGIPTRQAPSGSTCMQQRQTQFISEAQMWFTPKMTWSGLHTSSLPSFVVRNPLTFGLKQ